MPVSASETRMDSSGIPSSSATTFSITSLVPAPNSDIQVDRYTAPRPVTVTLALDGLPPVSEWPAAPTPTPLAFLPSGDTQVGTPQPLNRSLHRKALAVSVTRLDQSAVLFSCHG